MVRMLQHVIMNAQMAHSIKDWALCAEAWAPSAKEQSTTPGVQKVSSTDSIVTAVEGQAPILQCPNCDEEFLVKDLVFCHKNECMSYTCEKCAEQCVMECQICGDFVCEDCWHEGGDEMSKDKYNLGSSCCYECAEED